MKLKILNSKTKIQTKLLQESYEVLAFGFVDKVMRPILIVNDDLRICDMDESSIQILDSETNDYIQANSFNDNNQFLIKRELFQYCKDFSHYWDIKNNHIWNRSKTINYFLNSGYSIPEHLIQSVLNKEYKLNLIEGYLKAVNNFVLIRYGYGYYEEFYFKELNSTTDHIPERFKDDMKEIELNTANYKQILLEFLTETIYLNKSGEKESANMIVELFKLIDSIFINDIDSITNIITFYNNEMIIGYESKYYSLIRSWGS